MCLNLKTRCETSAASVLRIFRILVASLRCAVLLTSLIPYRLANYTPTSALRSPVCLYHDQIAFAGVASTCASSVLTFLAYKTSLKLQTRHSFEIQPPPKHGNTRTRKTSSNITRRQRCATQSASTTLGMDPFQAAALKSVSIRVYETGKARAVRSNLQNVVRHSQNRLICIVINCGLLNLRLSYISPRTSDERKKKRKMKPNFLGAVLNSPFSISKANWFRFTKPFRDILFDEYRT